MRTLGSSVLSVSLSSLKRDVLRVGHEQPTVFRSFHVVLDGLRIPRLRLASRIWS